MSAHSIDREFEDDPPDAPLDPELGRKLEMSLAELELSVAAINSLENAGITTVRGIVGRTEEQLLAIRNFKEAQVEEIRAELRKLDLDLGMNLNAP